MWDRRPACPSSASSQQVVSYNDVEPALSVVEGVGHSCPTKSPGDKPGLFCN
jgi:hypothetical protein